MNTFDLTPEKREDLFTYLLNRLESYYEETDKLPVSPSLDPQVVRHYIESFARELPKDSKQALDHVMKGLELYAVHTPHPSYYGLFNPRANMASIMADLITAVYNPQMAAWSHNPFANETETYLVREIGMRFGYPTEKIDGVFGSGGAEANLTAVLCALNHSVPEYQMTGIASLQQKPMLYCSTESHHSILRGARVSGLGMDSVTMIPLNDRGQMDPLSLEDRLKEDLNAGISPVMVVATAGATGTGVIDPLVDIGQICHKYGVWYHVDAAFGGAAILSQKSNHCLKGIEMSQSITFDVHKWLSVPMAASMFITSDPEILHKTFRLEAEYMPREAQHLSVTDPYSHSIQWSRRFTGLKLYLSLLFFGWKGYEEVIDNQMEIGRYLRSELINAGWDVLNESPLPVYCFTDARFRNDPDITGRICEWIIQSGRAWISTYPFNGTPCLRACITNYRTTRREIDALVDLLSLAREKFI